MLRWTVTKIRKFRKMDLRKPKSVVGVANSELKKYVCGLDFEAIFEAILTFREDRPWSKAMRVGGGEYRVLGLGNLPRACAY